MPRPEFLDLALKCGAVLTSKPDGSEAITVVFTIPAWQAFDAMCIDQSRAMFIARLEHMSPWVSTQTVLDILNDCDMLAARSAVGAPVVQPPPSIEPG